MFGFGQLCTGICRVVLQNLKRIYKINGKEIESLSQEKDLGILIQEDLDWDSHVAKISNQANRILEMIRRNYEEKSVKNIGQLYNSFVRPHLEYALQA